MKHLRTLLHSTGAIALVSFGFGCSSSLGDFTLLASKNVDLSHFDSQPAERSVAVTGDDMRPTFCIFGTGFPNLKEATDRAEEAGHSSGLTNARIVVYSWYIPFVYGESHITVTGNPLPR